MTNKTITALFMISVLLSGTTATMNTLPSSDAMKGRCTYCKVGSATKGTVCGDTLCSETNQGEKTKKEEKNKEQVKTGKKAEEKIKAEADESLTIFFF